MDRLHWMIATPEERQQAMDDAELAFEQFKAMSAEQIALRLAELMNNGRKIE